MIDALFKSVLACLEIAYTMNVAVLYCTVTRQFSLVRLAEYMDRRRSRNASRVSHQKTSVPVTELEVL